MKSPREIPWHDSLYAHHSYLSHLPQGLSQLVSFYLDSGPWKVRFGRAAGPKIKTQDMSGDDLALYNAADCRVNILAWHAMQADLSNERHVYEHDLCLAEMCAEMQQVGIRIDLARNTLLSNLLAQELQSYRTQMAILVQWPDPESFKATDTNVREILYQRFKIPRTKFTPTGKLACDKSVIEALRADPDTEAGQFAGLLSKFREARKIKSTYVDWPIKGDKKTPEPITHAYLQNPSPYNAPDRCHYSWGPRERRGQETSGGGHTVSGRLACRIQSAPKYNPDNTPDRCREFYIPGPGQDFVYFDVSQGEPRVAAYLSGDPARIETTNGDVHANNAKIMFPEAAAQGLLDGEAKKDPARGKPLRDLAKNMGLAIDYFAEAERVWKYLLQNRFDSKGRALYGAPRLETVKVIISKIRFVYRKYVAFVLANHNTVKQTGWMRDPILGRLRWLGRHCAITDVANFPIQAALAAIMNLRCLVLRRSPRFIQWARQPAGASKLALIGVSGGPEKWPSLPRGAALVLQQHDSTIYDTPKLQVPAMRRVISDLWDRPIKMPGGDLVLPIDLKVGQRWSEL